MDTAALRKMVPNVARVLPLVSHMQGPHDGCTSRRLHVCVAAAAEPLLVASSRRSMPLPQTCCLIFSGPGWWCLQNGVRVCMRVCGGVRRVCVVCWSAGTRRLEGGPRLREGLDGSSQLPAGLAVTRHTLLAPAPALGCVRCGVRGSRPFWPHNWLNRGHCGQDKAPREGLPLPRSTQASLHTAKGNTGTA